MQSNKRATVLFVDDEEKVVSAVRRNLISSDFKILTATSAKEGLKVLEQNQIDVVVSDLRMPEIDGNKFLEEVSHKYPKIIRFILSGHAEKQMILKSVGVTHQLLAKPCDSQVLIASLSAALRLRDLINNERMASLASELSSLPSLPELYLQLQTLTNDPESNMTDIASVIRQDAPMTAKIMQVANSAFFANRQVDNTDDAISIIGIETLKSLVLLGKIFLQLNASASPLVQMERLWAHSIKVASAAKSIALHFKPEPAFAEMCYTAGLLHDLGRLILWVGFPEKYSECVAKSANGGGCLMRMEKDAFGVSHPEVGAYLLGLWGLPISIVEAVAFHHDPSHAFNLEFSPLGAVYVSEVVSIQKGEEFTEALDLHSEYLKSVGLWHEWSEWMTFFKKEDDRERKS